MKAAKVCSEPGCIELDCTVHGSQWRDRRRGNASARGYDATWRRRRIRFLAANPRCIDCGGAATVPDHAPISRRQLVAMGDPDPDADRHLQPRCASCHTRRTNRVDGGFGNPIRRGA